MKYQKPVRLDNPTPEVLRDCIKNGICWWCGRGGWKALGIHTSRAHGITANELRQIAGLFKHIPTCSIELSNDMSLRTKQQLKNGISKLPKQKGRGYTKDFSEAGRKYQDEVRTAIILSNRPKAMAKLAELRLEGQHFGKPVKPHLCPVCGKPMPYAHPITCSPECRKIIRQNTCLESKVKIKILMDNDPVYKQRVKDNMSKGSKKSYAEGKLPSNPPKPHFCRICGTLIPKATPRLCSAECRHKAFREAQILATSNRNLKIPISERSIIARRYNSGEPGAVIAREYGISARYVRLIGNNKR